MIGLSVHQHVFKVCNGYFYARIGHDLFTYLIPCVDDSGMISTSKHVAYLRERHWKQLGDKIYRDHARLHNVFGLLFREDIVCGDVEIFTYGIYDIAGVYRIFFILYKIAQRLIGELLGVSMLLTVGAAVVFACAALFFKIATLVSISGTWISTVRPQLKRVRSLSSSVVRSFGDLSEVRIIGLLR